MEHSLAKKIHKPSKYFNRLVVKSLLSGRDSSVAALAEALGISTPYMYDLLWGRRNATAYVSAVAKLLNVDESAIVAAPDQCHGKAA